MTGASFFFIIILNIATSVISAISGVAGGIILLAALPYFLPPAAIIPVHGATQLASNFSRAWFGRHSIVWSAFFRFFVGGIFGACVFGYAISFVRLDAITLFVGLYILATQWSRTFSRALKTIESYFLLGFLQTGLGLFVGTPGPLAVALLSKNLRDLNAIISTSALMSSVVHLAKLPVFFALGFDFLAHFWLIFWMMIAAVLGSALGERVRKKIATDAIRRVMPWVLSALAIELIISHFVKKFF